MGQVLESPPLDEEPWTWRRQPRRFSRGNWLKPIIRFGCSVEKNFGSRKDCNRSVLEKNRNRRFRFRCIRFGVQFQPIFACTCVMAWDLVVDVGLGYRHIARAVPRLQVAAWPLRTAACSSTPAPALSPAAGRCSKLTRHTRTRLRFRARFSPVTSQAARPRGSSPALLAPAADAAAPCSRSSWPPPQCPAPRSSGCRCRHALLRACAAAGFLGLLRAHAMLPPPPLGAVRVGGAAPCSCSLRRRPEVSRAATAATQDRVGFGVWVEVPSGRASGLWLRWAGPLGK
jgi:hypothetical protein